MLLFVGEDGGGGSILLSGLAGSLEVASWDSGYEGDTESWVCGTASQGKEEKPDFPPSYAKAVHGIVHYESVEGAGSLEWGPGTPVWEGQASELLNPLAPNMGLQQ